MFHFRFYFSLYFLKISDIFFFFNFKRIYLVSQVYFLWLKSYDWFCSYFYLSDSHEILPTLLILRIFNIRSLEATIVPVSVFPPRLEEGFLTNFDVLIANITIKKLRNISFNDKIILAFHGACKLAIINTQLVVVLQGVRMMRYSSPAIWMACIYGITLLNI